MKAQKEKSRYASLILAGVVLAVALVSALVMRAVQASRGPQNMIYVEVDGADILRVPLGKDARYVIRDGVPEKVSADTTLESLGDDALPENHDINIIEIRDGGAFCFQSNCENQVCVNMGTLSGDAYDTPIVCLPHSMFVFITQEE